MYIFIDNTVDYVRVYPYKFEIDVNSDQHNLT